MSLLALNGGLWGNFTTIYWISKYLQHLIHIWNKNSYWIMVKVGNENGNHALNILYENNHFELAITCDYMIKFSNIHTCATYDTKFEIHNINDENNEVQHKQKKVKVGIFN